jgi:tRNA_anti-like
MLKIIIFGIAIVLLCLAALGIYKITRAHQSVAGVEASATITADNLYLEFEHGEDKATAKWVGKVIEITGKISVVTEAENFISITLATTGQGGVNCSFSRKELGSMEQFKKGDTVIIKGKCTGFLMDVNMVDCVIKNS